MSRGEYFPFKDLEEIRHRVRELDLGEDIGFVDSIVPEDGSDSRTMSKPFNKASFDFDNRWGIHPMEGWDGDAETGSLTDDVRRRWIRIGESGASLIWGVEALTIDHDYRANPNQLVIVESNVKSLEEGLMLLRGAHAKSYGPNSKLVVGAQITNSGRYSFGRPEGSPLQLVYHHPDLDARLGADDNIPLMSDAGIDRVIDQYIAAAKIAHKVGFDFIDIKACHRYWLNETLAAKTRPGKYGGSFENRTKIILSIIDGIKAELGSDFPMASRINVYDGLPFEEDPDQRREGMKGKGRPSPYTIPYLWGFGVDEDDPIKQDITEPLKLIGLLREKGIKMIAISAGSPYSNPHLIRPTEVPPVDGYQPHHDPLHEVALHFRSVKKIKEEYPDILVMGSGYSYLRQFKGHAAEYNLEHGLVDVVGVGRAVLSYHDEIKCILEEGEAPKIKGRVICTGDSACTSGPRLGFKSGCIYDPYYNDMIKALSKKLREMGLTRK